MTTVSKPHTSMVAFRVDDDLLTELDNYWKSAYYKDRSSCIIEILRSHLSGVVCPYCGVRNPRGGRVCSVCLRPLTHNDEWSRISALLDAHPEMVREYFAKKERE